MEFKDILAKFKIDGEFVSCEPYGSGLINKTYVSVFNENNKRVRYIVQKINSNLFKDVDKLMNNIRLVTEFMRKKIIAEGGNPDRESLTLIFTKDGKPYFKASENEYYRVYIFIENATGYNIVEKPEHFYESAVAFGKFANLLAEFESEKLYEAIPDFHNTVKRFSAFEEALKENKFGRAKEVGPEIDFVLKRKDYCGKILNLSASGDIPLRVTHNDTKLNNVLIDDNTGKAVCVIDLDTIMPGSICYDFGDSIRFGCNPCLEDSKELDKVNFRLDLFEVYAKGYLSVFGKEITDAEKQNLSFGSILMTYECGMRFLTDYLSGDTYFRTTRAGQNLDRARTQFKLVSDMEKRINEMNAIINKN